MKNHTVTSVATSNLKLLAAIKLNTKKVTETQSDKKMGASNVTYVIPYTSK
jgi:hypothetical protein